MVSSYQALMSLHLTIPHPAFFAAIIVFFQRLLQANIGKRKIGALPLSYDWHLKNARRAKTTALRQNSTACAARHRFDICGRLLARPRRCSNDWEQDSIKKVKSNKKILDS